MIKYKFYVYKINIECGERKLRNIRLIILALIMSLLMGIMGQVSVQCDTLTNIVNLFCGESAASESNVATTVVSAKNGGNMDTSIMNEDGYFYVEYTGDKEAVRLVLQSWSGGESWVTILPSETGVTKNDEYYAKFSDETIRTFYPQNYSTIDQIHIWAVDGNIVLKSIDYIVERESENNFIELSYAPTESNVKYLGRTYFYKNALWCALSGSGAEYTFNGTKAEVTLLGDNVSQWGVDGLYSRVAIYVNGERVIDTLIKDREVTFKVFESDEPQDVTIKIVKLSESAYSTVGIKNLKVISTNGIRPAENKDRIIEFIGDSITCGYGVDDENPNNHFSTATEDITKTYAYKTAEALNADYSIVSYSGFGIISGYTQTGDKEDEMMISSVYGKVGKSYGDFNNEIAPSTIEWDFQKIQPDLIVINLGTNDISYCGEDEIKHSEFVDGYVDFLKIIREKNPDSKILCTLGILGDSVYGDIENAAARYTEETGDENISCMKFEYQLYSDGISADYHPTEATHSKAAAKLINEIRQLME